MGLMFDGEIDDVEDIEHDEITMQAFEELCMAVFQKKDELDAKKEELKSMGQELDELNGQVMAHLTKFNKDKHHTAWGTLSIRRAKSFTTPKDPDSREAYFNWLKTLDVYDDMVSVNSRTLNAHANKEVENAEAAGDLAFNPPGLGEPKLYEKISIRRTK